MIERFSSIDVTKILNIQRQRLRGWTEDTLGFFKPSIQESGGPGQKALYSTGDIFSFALFQDLIEGAQLDRKTAATFVNSCREKIQTDKDWLDITYISIRTTVHNEDTNIAIVIYRETDPGLDECLKVQYKNSFTIKKDDGSLEQVELPWKKNYIVNFQEVCEMVKNGIKDLYSKES